jgi:hypothetical protein
VASFDDLGAALIEDAAANAPRAAQLDIAAAIRASRARRRPRVWAVGVSSVTAVLMAGGIVVATVPAPPTMIAATSDADAARSSEADDAGSLSAAGGPESAIERGECGAALAPASLDVGGLTLTVSVPARVAIGDGSVPIAVEVLLENRTRAPVSVEVIAEPLVALLDSAADPAAPLWRSAESIAAVTMTLELAAGQTAALPASVLPWDCRFEPPGAPGAAGYLVTAQLLIAAIDGVAIDAWLASPPVPIALD